MISVVFNFRTKVVEGPHSFDSVASYLQAGIRLYMNTHPFSLGVGDFYLQIAELCSKAG